MRTIAVALMAALGACAPTGAGERAGTGLGGGSANAIFSDFSYSGSDPTDAASTPARDEYRNPILQGFYPDPSITRVGDRFYLVHSTFSYFPGIPVFESRDLVNWTQIGNAIDRPDQLDFGTLGLSRGVFAPTIEEKDGTFYIFNTCVDCGGNFVVTATDPAGPWSDPVFLPDMEGGIDPALFFDTDGQAWVLNNGPPVGTPRYDGHRAIWIQRFDTKTLKTFGPRKVLVDGGVDPSKNPVWIEGPHVIAKDGWYYLTCAEGGTAEAHSQVVLRSRKPDGPYTPWEGNPFLTQRGLPADRANPITSAGHADLVQLPNGDWWATFLAVRPYKGDFYNTGRETFLMPVEWPTGGWPRITEPNEVLPHKAKRPPLPDAGAPPVPTNGPFTVRESFAGPTLAPYWMMMRNPQADWYDVGGGALTLTPRPVSLGENGNPSFLGRRRQHRDASAEVTMRYMPAGQGDEAGLVALQSDDFWFAVTLTRIDGALMVRASERTGADDPKVGRTIATRPWNGGPIRLRIVGNGQSYSLHYGAADGAWQTIADGLDATQLSTRTAGGFVGAVFGPYAYDAP